MSTGRRPILEVLSWVATIVGTVVAVAIWYREAHSPTEGTTQIRVGPILVNQPNSPQTQPVTGGQPPPAQTPSTKQATKADPNAPDQSYRRKYLSETVSTSPAVVAVNSDGTINSEAARTLAAAIGGVSGLFKPAFVGDGLFASAFSGDSSSFDRLGLTSSVPEIILAELDRRHAGANVEGEAITKATAKLSVRVFRRTRTSSFSVEEQASAFSPEDAERRASEAALSKAAARLKETP